ncbi:MAG: hypothetical protein K2W96_14855, partial [Gemmataceae bacterium]|nr:hypothetical protein [Gemmataceae bacterium]
SPQVEGVVLLWEAATGGQVAKLPTRQGISESLAWTADGRGLLSGGADGTILLFDMTGRKGMPARLDATSAEARWQSLAGEPARAFAAVQDMASSREGIALLGRKLSPAKGIEAALEARLLADLDSDDFEKRKTAEAELAKHGDAAQGSLRRALVPGLALEPRRRIEKLLEARESLPESRQRSRAVWALEMSGSREAVDILAKLAKADAGAPLTEEAKKALDRRKR